ncbi:MAG: Gfo/Idh/MocA family oxidoreductase [Lachnospiraceae bacterium]|nr:Gfo/Idh/MocA family oxidoreductase [Lachnospiraceae bacterium]
MNIGILGTGFGAYHAELFSTINDVNTIYVFGRNPEKLKNLESRLGIHPVTDINEIMENDKIDLVDICLPSNLHCTYALQALKHNKHVLCETPVATNIADAIAMQTAQQKSRKLLMVDLFMRFEHAYQVLASIVKSGEYGKLQKLQIQRNPPPIWGNLGPNNIVTALMTHDIDFVSYLMGRPEKMQVEKVLGKVGQYSVSLLCSYGNAFAEINASSMMPMGYPFSVSYEAILDNAVVRYYEDRYKGQNDRIDTKLTLYTENASKDIIPHNDCYYEMIRYAVKMVQSAEKPINDISDAVISMDMALRIQDLII